jgi:ubiquinone/menaquinone biosynthesis C-methylase UbiE
MDRHAWLTERRAAVEEDYTRDAPTYDAGYDPITPVHRRWVARLIETVPRGGSILDCPCGTGPYLGMVREAGRIVVGADQSPGMLAEARRKQPGVRLEQVGLQELRFDGEFDGAMCIDSLEHVPPEEWPLVAGNLHRALTPGGHLYLTVEEIDRSQLEHELERARAAGLPALFGEAIGTETGGYHYYPDRAEVSRHLMTAGFELVDDDTEPLDGYAYHHILARRT